MFFWAYPRRLHGNVAGKETERRCCPSLRTVNSPTCTHLACKTSALWGRWRYCLGSSREPSCSYGCSYAASWSHPTGWSRRACWECWARRCPPRRCCSGPIWCRRTAAQKVSRSMTEQSFLDSIHKNKAYYQAKCSGGFFIFTLHSAIWNVHSATLRCRFEFDSCFSPTYEWPSTFFFSQLKTNFNLPLYCTRYPW